jgi:hypothetical protein
LDSAPAETPTAASDKIRRRVMGVGLLALFVVGMAVFVAPFAFPTRPPVVTRFQATRQFSPNQDGTREVARIAVRLNEPSFIDVEIRGLDDRRWKGLIAEQRPKGIVRLTWDGTDDQGRPVPDGQYVVRLRAEAGRRKWNASRRTILDRTAPPLGTLTVTSAALAGPGEGECRVTTSALDRGTVLVEAAPGAEELAVARTGPTAVAAGDPVVWNWDGKRADGTPAPPGLYVIRASLTDVPGNRSTQSATCWAGHLIGAAAPARPRLGARAGVRLRRLDGSAIPPSTRVTLEVYRRIGDPGSSTLVLGSRVGARVSGPAGRVRLPLPRRIPPRDLWLVATTEGGRALIPLRP